MEEMNRAIVIESVCETFGIDKEDLFSKNRMRPLVYARNVCYYLFLNELEDRKLHIAKFFNKDHSTVIHGIEVIEECLRFVDQGCGTDLDYQVVRSISVAKSLLNTQFETYLY